jgi:hypothetical protein
MFTNEATPEPPVGLVRCTPSLAARMDTPDKEELKLMRTHQMSGRVAFLLRTQEERNKADF